MESAHPLAAGDVDGLPGREAIKNRLKYYERIGARKANASGIEATLAKLRDRYPAQ